MGWRINEVIQRELVDDYCKEPIYSEEIKFTGDSITDMLFLTQDGQTVSLTYWQLYELYKVLENNHPALWGEG